MNISSVNTCSLLRYVHLAFSLVLSGCAAEEAPCSEFPEPPETLHYAAASDVWHGDVTFTTEERALIEQGAAFLSAHTKQGAIQIVWDAPHAAYSDETCPVMHIVRQARGAKVGGRASTTCMHLDEKPEWVENDQWAGMVSHEWGHTRRLKHHNGTGLLQPINPPLLWTEEDQSACVAAGSCD